jgi:hypothetical protein
LGNDSNQRRIIRLKRIVKSVQQRNVGALRIHSGLIGRASNQFSDLCAREAQKRVRQLELEAATVGLLKRGKCVVSVSMPGTRNHIERIESMEIATEAQRT